MGQDFSSTADELFISIYHPILPRPDGVSQNRNSNEKQSDKTQIFHEFWALSRTKLMLSIKIVIVFVGARAYSPPSEHATLPVGQVLPPPFCWVFVSTICPFLPHNICWCLACLLHPIFVNKIMFGLHYNIPLLVPFIRHIYSSSEQWAATNPV